MEKKFDKMTTISAILLVLATIHIGIIDSDNTIYSQKIEQTQLMLSNKMKTYCITYNESLNITMSQEGLNGACGITNYHYNDEKNCMEFTTFGENITGVQTAKEVMSIISGAPSMNYNIFGFQLNKNIVTYALLVLALVFQIGSLTGFKKPFF